MSVAAPARTSSVIKDKTTTLDSLGGAGGAAFAVIIVLQNILRAQAPSFGAAPAKVAAYFGHHRTAVLIPLGLFPIGMVALFAFVAALWTRAASDESRWWAHLGVLGATTIAGLFAVVNITEIALAAKSDQLTSSPPVVQALWAIHAGAFGLDLAANGGQWIAVGLVGFLVWIVFVAAASVSLLRSAGAVVDGGR
jgi:hypothetical protein